MEKKIIDPLGNQIDIPQQIMDINEELIQSEDVLDDVSKVIEKPAMLFQMQNGDVELYYLRAIGWNKTMLLGVRKKGEHYEVLHFELDPSVQRLSQLEANGQRVI